MKNEALQMAKGVRDFGPADKIARDRIVGTLKEVFELFGYNPIETPVLERYELFASKFGVGEQTEAMAESFQLTDQGKRNLVLRNEFTVPFARFIAENPQLRMPFKRYQMGDVFRDGPIKLGRYREFWQCDVDVVGIDNNLIDAELLELANMVFGRLELDVEIKINNRKLLNAILAFAGVSKESEAIAIIAIDKMDKIGADGVSEELAKLGIEQKSIKTVLNLLSIAGTNEQKIKELKNILGENEGLLEIEQTLKNLISETDIEFLPSLARGQAYYTGNVFEIYLKSKKITSSLCAGGRFNNMIAGFLGQEKNIPAIGISFGLDTIFDAMTLETVGFSAKKSVCEAYVIPIGESVGKYARKTLLELRKRGVKVDMDFLARKTGKNMEYADSYGIPWAILIGEEEVQTGKLTLRDMLSGNQTLLTVTDIVDRIKS
jgi:histidyl-tRNA synthetase